MSIQYISAVLQDPYFTQTDKTKLLVAIAIANCANAEDGSAWPSLEHLARVARTSVRGVQKACYQMQTDGKLAIETGGSAYGTNVYRLLLSKNSVEKQTERSRKETTVPQTVSQTHEAPDGVPIQFTQNVRNRNETSGTPPPIIPQPSANRRAGVSKIDDKKKIEIEESPTPRTHSRTHRKSSSPSPKAQSPRQASRAALQKSDEAKRIARLFDRTAAQPWSQAELDAFAALHPIDPNDLDLIEAYYAAEQNRPNNHLRRSLQTFLNNYTGELDRARVWKKRKSSGLNRTREEIIHPDQKSINYKGPNPFKSIR